MGNKFKRTNRMGNLLDCIRLPMGKIVHRINTPFIAGSVMMGMLDTIHQGIAQMHIR